jgi:RNA-directed DNA polymerase
MMHGHEKSDPVIVAMKPANKANEAHCGGVCGANAAESVERRAGAKGNTHQHNTYWTQSQARVTNALERIRPLSPYTPEVGEAMGRRRRRLWDLHRP